MKRNEMNEIAEANTQWSGRRDRAGFRTCEKVSVNDNVIFPVDTLIAKGISEPRDYGSETAHSVPWRHLRRDEVHY